MNSDSNRQLNIVCVGDIALHGKYANWSANAASSLLKKIAHEWQFADLRTGNLESPITKRRRVASAKHVLRGAPNSVQVLKSSGFDVLSLANNHQMDFGPGGIADTKNELDAQGIMWLGAGDNCQGARTPRIINTESGKVGFLAWCDVEQNSPLYALSDNPGVALFQLDRAVEEVKSLRQQVDWLVIHLHWGLEFSQLPSPKQRACARRLAEEGVDLIIGHHPHVLQGAEVIDKTAVLYSLGNFTFSPQLWEGKHPNGSRFAGRYRLHPLTRESGWVKISLSRKSAPKVAFHATYLKHNLKVVPDRRPARLEKWNSLCQLLLAERYDEYYAQESRLAKTRNRWSEEWRTVVGRIQLKLFKMGFLRGFRDV